MRGGVVSAGAVLEQLELAPPSTFRGQRRQRAGNVRARVQEGPRRGPAADPAAVPARGSRDLPTTVLRLCQVLERAARPFREPDTDRFAVKVRARELYEADRQLDVDDALHLAQRVRRWLIEEGKA